MPHAIRIFLCAGRQRARHQEDGDRSPESVTRVCGHKVARPRGVASAGNDIQQMQGHFDRMIKHHRAERHCVCLVAGNTHVEHDLVVAASGAEPYIGDEVVEA